jgi:hypothetical protein
MFEKASRKKLRFVTDKGLLETEDLWDLSLVQLNAIAKHFNRELKDAKDEDFLDDSRVDEGLKLQFDIVLHILNAKKEEAKKKKELAVKKEKKQKILEILAKKQDASLENMSEEDLLKQLNDLDI